MIVTRANGIYTVYERDDETTSRLSDHDDERWLDQSDGDSDPVAWRVALNYADDVFLLGESLLDPSAELSPDSDS
ncbi:hypothetical protein [Streptosporangium sp. G12]